MDWFDSIDLGFVVLVAIGVWLGIFSWSLTVRLYKLALTIGESVLTWIGLL